MPSIFRIAGIGYPLPGRQGAPPRAQTRARYIFLGPVGMIRRGRLPCQRAVSCRSQGSPGILSSRKQIMKVLVIEDEDDIREVACMCLSDDASLEVIDAGSG